LVKAPDFDSGMRRFESFLPCQIRRQRTGTNVNSRWDAHAGCSIPRFHGFHRQCQSRAWPPKSPSTWASRWARPQVGRFSDGEVTVEIKQNVRARDVFVVQSTCAPTNENLMELLIMVDALKRASAERISAVIPTSAMPARTAARAPRACRSPPRWWPTCCRPWAWPAC
jgi:hypothetical protein